MLSTGQITIHWISVNKTYINQVVHVWRVVAKKIVSAKVFIEPVNISCERPGTKLHPQSSTTPTMQGYQASCLQDGGHSTQKDNMLVLKTKFYFNYFTHYSGTDTRGYSQEFIPNFSFIQFNVDHILSVVLLPSDRPAKSSWRSRLPQPLNFAGSQCLTTTLIKKCNVSKDV